MLYSLRGMESAVRGKTLQNATWRTIGECIPLLAEFYEKRMLFIGDFYRKFICFSMVDVKVVVVRLVLCFIRPEQHVFRSSRKYSLLVTLPSSDVYLQDLVRALAVQFLWT